MSGIKNDGDKPRTDLLSAEAILELSKVLAMGASKYEPWNWSKGIAYSRIIGAILRHILLYMSGESVDKESGLSHISHAMCGCMFLLHYEKYRPEFDDRPKEAYEKSKQS